MPLGRGAWTSRGKAKVSSKPGLDAFIKSRHTFEALASNGARAVHFAVRPVGSGKRIDYFSLQPISTYLRLACGRNTNTTPTAAFNNKPHHGWNRTPPAPSRHATPLTGSLHAEHNKYFDQDGEIRARKVLLYIPQKTRCCKLGNRRFVLCVRCCTAVLGPGRNYKHVHILKRGRQPLL